MSENGKQRTGRAVAGELRQILEGMRQTGTAAVDIHLLINYLQNVENDPSASAAASEEIRLVQENENRRTDAKLALERDNAIYREVNKAGDEAARSLFLLNGGAAISALTFVGHLASVQPSFVPSWGSPLAWFGVGAFLATGIYSLKYLAHWTWGRNPPGWQMIVGNILNVAAIMCGVASFVTFALGVSASWQAFIAMAATGP